MADRAFFDTNVLIYAVVKDDPRGAKAEALLAGGGVLSVQVLNEFVSVARRKFRMPWPEMKEALAASRVLWSPPVPITLDIHETALGIAERYGYGFYDALIIAAALRAQCAVLYSEDLKGDQIIDGRLTIRNPF